jgi:hypothetical protein
VHVGHESSVAFVSIGEADPVAAAFVAVALHSADPDGWCVGCLTEGDAARPAPCPVARQWRGVVETLGVMEWDLLPEAGDAGVCGACEGRGWKFVAARSAPMWAENADGLMRRRCTDCGGRPDPNRRP